MGRLRKWLILKLGGYVLSAEEVSMLVVHRIPNMSKVAKKQMEKDCIKILDNGFTNETKHLL